MIQGNPQRGAPIQDDHHVLTHVGPRHVEDDVINGDAFLGRPQEDAPSVNWVKCLNPPTDNQVAEIRGIVRMKYARTGKLVRLNVGTARNYVDRNSPDGTQLSFVHDPLPESERFDADPSHALIRGAPVTEDAAAELVKDLIADCVVLSLYAVVVCRVQTLWTGSCIAHGSTRDHTQIHHPIPLGALAIRGPDMPGHNTLSPTPFSLLCRAARLQIGETPMPDAREARHKIPGLSSASLTPPSDTSPRFRIQSEVHVDTGRARPSHVQTSPCAPPVIPFVAVIQSAARQKGGRATLELPQSLNLVRLCPPSLGRNQAFLRSKAGRRHEAGT